MNGQPSFPKSGRPTGKCFSSPSILGTGTSAVNHGLLESWIATTAGRTGRLDTVPCGCPWTFWRPQSRGRSGRTAGRMDRCGLDPSGHDRRHPPGGIALRRRQETRLADFLDACIQVADFASCLDNGVIASKTFAYSMPASAKMATKHNEIGQLRKFRSRSRTANAGEDFGRIAASGSQGRDRARRGISPPGCRPSGGYESRTLTRRHPYRRLRQLRFWQTPITATMTPAGGY